MSDVAKAGGGVPTTVADIVGYVLRQASAGAIVGLSAVIFALSYGALLFSGPLAAQVGYGIAITLITGAFGALFGALSDEKSFISGPDSNTISVQASMFAAIAAAGGAVSLDLAVATIFLTTTLCAIVFLIVGRGRLSAIVRYIPFSVMAGFLVSGGWLMSSGALDIITGTPLSLNGVKVFLADPVRPELALGLLVTAALFGLAKRVPSAALIPLVMLAATVIAHLYLASGLCGTRCDVDIWRFSNEHAVKWMPPWDIHLDTADVEHIVASLPGMLVVCFVAVLTVLLSVSTLEITFQREFELNRMLRAHALLAGLPAALGGYIGLITIGRTVLNRQTGGKVLAGVIAAGICIAVLFGAGSLIFTIPKAALGGLVLYLGLSFLKHWLWDKRKSTSPLEYLQIFLILGIVANYGYMTGFAAGLLLSCVLFVVTYSRVPLANLATNLTVFSSSVVRPEYEVEILREHGGNTHVYRLGGYVFFGSASKIEAVFKNMGEGVECVVIDFTNVSGIDGSAIGVFRRILRRYWGSGIRFNFVTSPNTENAIRHFSPDDGGSLNVHHFASLDHALESAEEAVLARWTRGEDHSSCFEFLDDPAERAMFEGYCERREIRQGETLSREGDLAAEVFFIAAGSFDVMKKNLRLAKLRVGAIVGEIAFYTGASRTASIIAARDGVVFAFHKDALARLRAEHPELATKFDLMVIRKVSGALARTSTLVTMFK